VHGGNGSDTCRYTCGTVFSITAHGKETLLHSFNPQPDGAHPMAGLIDVGGVFYGTTSVGGTNNDGTVFSLTASGKESIISSLAGGTGGASPYAPLIDAGGMLYGTTYDGGVTTKCCGTVFSLAP
jgi:uncharacterized repeat protein (TIGR03803 family)